MIGQTLAHYRIVEKIGAGGMGEVYRAQDLHLSRDVAIKVLPPGTLTDEPARRRFRKEAEALSKLNHPNIQTVHDFDTQEDVDFLVTEYVSGITLSDRLAGEGLPEKEVLRLGQQLAEGLAAAHEQGIIHRDLKPSNLRITPDGRLKILDFGVAKLVEPFSESAATQSLAESRAIVGTPLYMAPEQKLGEAVDARTDIYAAGLVLREMITGQPPRPGAGPDLTGIPLRLQPILEKCLEKEPEHRYHSAKELAVDLRRLERARADATPGEGSRPLVQAGEVSIAREGDSVTIDVGQGKDAVRVALPYEQFVRHRRLGLIILLTVLGVGLAVALLGFNVGGLRERLFAPVAPEIDSLAVLPLKNLMGDSGQEYFVEGMHEALTAELSHISSLRVISRTSTMRYKDTDKPLPQVARELNVTGVIEGSVLREGDQVRITLQLIHGPSDRHLWAQSFDRELRGILALQREVARAVARQIHVQLTPQEQTKLAGSRLVNPDAHEAYLRGRHSLNKQGEADIRNAIQLFNRAIEKDAAYAPAYAALADAFTDAALWYYMTPGEAIPQARAAALRALELDPNLAEAHVALGLVQFFHDWDWAASKTTIQRALELNPNYARAHWLHGWYLAAMGKRQEVLAAAQRTEQLDPLNLDLSTDVEFMLFVARQYDLAIAGCRQILQVDPNNGFVRAVLALALVEKGFPEEAAAEALAARRADDGLLVLAVHSDVLARAGRKGAARRALAELEERIKKAYVCSYEIAIAYYHLGETSRAFEWLEQAYRERANCMPLLKVDPRFDGLRDDPRFQTLLRRMNFPE